MCVATFEPTLRGGLRPATLCGGGPDPAARFCAYTEAMPDDTNRSHRHSRSARETLEAASPRSSRAFGQSTFLSVVRQVPAGPFSPIIAGLVVIVLIGVTLYVGWMVRESTRQGMAASLETVLSANVKSLELWLNDQFDVVRAVASDPPMQRSASVLVEAPAAVGRESAAWTELSRRIDDLGYIGWVLTDAGGTVIQGSDSGWDGHSLTLTREQIKRLVAGEATVTQPMRTPGGDGDSHADDAAPRTVLFVVAAFGQGLQTQNFIGLMLDSDEHFAETLSLARVGQISDTYAFNRDGVMISPSRFDTQLRTFGILGMDQPSTLNVSLRDPGVDLRRKRKSLRELRERPLTQLADSATRGGSGTDVVGYRDYRGVRVIGAWRWLPEYDFGVATEMDYDQAYVPLRILRNAFWALLATAGIAGSVLLATAWVTRRDDSNAKPITGLNRRLGQYRLQQCIGRGGMGTVYAGKHCLLERKVAIKVLEHADATERSLARFQREVQLSAQLMHPNTIEIYDFGRTDEGTFFYVMEFVDGISLEQLVQHYGRQPAERVIYLLLQVCGSLSEAHQCGLVHRDIKPANVLLTSRSGLHDLIKVLDFGLAKRLDQESRQLTRTDGLTGTPLYMSPEAIRDASSANELSDIYSIGALGYTLLSGVPPFEGESSADVCAKKLNGAPEPPERRIGLPLAEDLQTVLMRCLQLDPGKRPPSAKQLAVELLACVDSPHWTQQDAALWWREVFDGPFVNDFESSEKSGGSHHTRGDTAVNASRPEVHATAQSTVS